VKVKLAGGLLGSFLSLGQYLEEQLCTPLIEFHVAELVQK
jgi:hypothetical protein